MPEGCHFGHIDAGEAFGAEQGPTCADDDVVANTAIDLEAATVKWQSLKNRNPSKSSAGVARPSQKPVHTLDKDFAFEANEA